MPQTPYLGDLEKTNFLFELVQTPRENRGEWWKKQFLAAVTMASFRCGEPQVMNGPDGFPYFQLLFPQPGVGFTCYVIDKMKDDFLLDNGLGVVVNPSGNSADWVFSHGDILNLHLNNEFYSTNSSFSKATKDEVVTEHEEVMIGQPSDTLLPAKTRKLLNRFLKLNGIQSPKILLMIRKKEDGTTQDLVFNFTPENFANIELHRSIMRTLGWYLPKHYSFVGLDEPTFGDGFMEL